MLSPDSGRNESTYLICGFIDSNGKPSCGPAQFLDRQTFWETDVCDLRRSERSSKVVSMMPWGLENGYIQKWSCAQIEESFLKIYLTLAQRS